MMGGADDDRNVTKFYTKTIWGLPSRICYDIFSLQEICHFQDEFEVWQILTYLLFIVVDVTLWKSFFESEVKSVVVPWYYSIAGQHVFCGHAKREGPYSSYERKMWLTWSARSPVYEATSRERFVCDWLTIPEKRKTWYGTLYPPLPVVGLQSSITQELQHGCHASQVNNKGFVLSSELWMSGSQWNLIWFVVIQVDLVPPQLLKPLCSAKSIET